MSVPRISIITPSYQQAGYLAECLESISTQQDAEVEHIVVDGGSTDGSRAIIERHTSELHWWCSAPDKGQSDAINKGLVHATGRIFTWVNSDDALLPGALRQVSEAFASDPHLLVFGGRLIHRDASGDRVFERLNDVCDPAQLYRDPVINQPATFYRLDVVKEIGGVDPALRYVMDVELWWQVLFRYGIDHLRFEPVELAMFRMHDQSKTVTAHHGFLDELANLIHAMCLRSGAPEWRMCSGWGIPSGTTCAAFLWKPITGRSCAASRCTSFSSGMASSTARNSTA
ncbi:MAG: glycosyltransferase [Flavobacteriales bacterium]|nr:glycosyltransferase [Flavobacteriales bacterium]